MRIVIFKISSKNVFEKNNGNFRLKVGIDGNLILKLNFDSDWFDIENIQKYFVVIVIFALESWSQNCWQYLWCFEVVVDYGRFDIAGNNNFSKKLYCFIPKMGRNWPKHNQKWPIWTQKMTLITWPGVSVKTEFKIEHFESKITIQNCHFQTKIIKSENRQKIFLKNRKTWI